jgi:hypothetical protein
MSDDSLAQLRAIWQAAGRPSQAKLRDAAKRQGLNVTVQRAQNIARASAPPPKSEGKATAPELNSRWQCDLIDCKAKSPGKNDDSRRIFVCIDVFSRFMHTELLKTKEAEEVSEAFQKTLRRARGNTAIKGQSRTASVQKVSADTGAKIKGPFAEMLKSPLTALRWSTLRFGPSRS